MPKLTNIEQSAKPTNWLRELAKEQMLRKREAIAALEETLRLKEERVAEAEEEFVRARKESERVEAELRKLKGD